ncbi:MULTISPECIES: DUF1285 domain-containing protein [unclassified Novosphingobium]|uniref:DUF1285 domain-containing protein n=1 Tax=unclassified Novosphingobium TaxID=2644732 RepID=UPI00086BF31F|nr:MULTISPECIES: DUF1285 domain-containing protein [unclassified Novosphingobium]MBN9143830.1 DUF1285 domain-containing protein [Novosphingobium sp.]MDR6707016.1 hypothetical protein [Novosphingobium sp. 1748]ODU84424.1 MAG: hypothetical protein ABT10_03365 [Novosphingobium sp. SCN 63-17]OJX92964.1 MAG: hypothetical protein BGP00_23965 [Novosphingobium sp. 63-713]
MPYTPPPDLAALSLEDIARMVAERRLPPVDQWHPAEELDSQMEIRADGSWWHQGGPITRPAMVRAFSTLLMRDDAGQHWLVTPQDRQRIAVVDAAFVAVDVARIDGALVFRLNTDDTVVAGPDHPLIARGDAETPAIYLAVRHGCLARIDRSTWGQLVDMALEKAGMVGGTDGGLSVDSLGISFPLTPQ